MGRSPCCSKEGLNRGAWTAQEDKILRDYISLHGQGKWRNLPQRAGLKRCGKSCRLRWLNYLRPDIKRGNISQDEEELIIRLHKLLGNRWSLIAGRLPGRTDNEIKNYWNTNLGKKVRDLQTPSNASSQQANETKNNNNNNNNCNHNNNFQKPTRMPPATNKVVPTTTPSLSPLNDSHSLLVRTKASKFSKSLFLDHSPTNTSLLLPQNKTVANNDNNNNNNEEELDEAGGGGLMPPLGLLLPSNEVAASDGRKDNNNMVMMAMEIGNNNNIEEYKEISTTELLLMDFDIGQICLPSLLNSDFKDICDFGYNNNNNSSNSNCEDLLGFLPEDMLVPSDEILKEATVVVPSNFCDETNAQAENSFWEDWS
ncbi:hypothetical protein PIB30_059514 [Stylosanthes scabra]|uniref:Uncharacterized protein n=1 Tax=Stylosanthes scabra TaxID=79078 RepID=A0ABU6ZIZ8_9FABA|nr:hypothetical protein [Stylosanthes scabra]